MDVISDPDEAYRVVSEEFNKQFDIRIGWSRWALQQYLRCGRNGRVYQQYGSKPSSDLAAVSENLVFFGAEHESLTVRTATTD
jgi:osmoprotectant transport system substrate-binding protein